MKIHILSDLHVEFGDLTAPRAATDVVVLAGDIHLGTRGIDWARSAYPDRPVVYVPGNHEYYGQAWPRLLEKIHQRAAGTHIRVLENEACEIEGVRFLGCSLWTDLAFAGNPAVAALEVGEVMNDYRRIRISPSYRRLLPGHTVAWHRESRRWLTARLAESHPGPTVVVTHHAPSGRSIPDHFRGHPANPAYVSSLDDLVARSSAALWIHGHIHDACDYRIGDTRVLNNPRGYPDQPGQGFRPGLVVEVG